MADRKLARLLRDISEGARTKRVPGDEADVLADMAHAGKPEVSVRLQFVLRYLPGNPCPPPVAQHGTLLASAKEVKEAVRRMRRDPITAAVWKELERRCRAYMRPGNPAHIDWQERRKASLWRQRQGHWALGRAMQDLAWAWKFSGEAAFADYAKGMLLTVARARQGWLPLGCNYGTPYNGWLNDNLLDIGHATLGPAVAYDLLRERCRPDERREIADYFEPFMYRVMTQRYFGVNFPGHNFAPIGFGGAGLLALALAADIPSERRGILKNVVAWAEAYARFTLDTVAGSDGAPVEGSGYGSASLHYLALFAEGLRRRCGHDLFTHPTWQRFARYLVLETLPGGGAFNNFNDNHYQTHVGFWPLVSRRVHAPVGDWVWLHHALPETAEAGPRRLRDSLVSELPLVILHRDPGADRATPAGMKIARVHRFRDQEHLVARTGWDAMDLHASFQCTRGRPGGHSQQDRLNFTLYALGERFVVDSGYGMQPIPGSTEVRRLGALAASHNQVLIDGIGQVTTKAPNAGRIIRWGEKGDWVWALGDAAGAYPDVRMARRLLAIRRTAASPVLVVVDWIVPSRDGAHRFDWLLQTATGNAVEPAEKAGSACIRGGRHGRELNLIHQPTGSVRLTVDEWIDHPRLCATSRGRVFLSLTVFGTGALTGSAGEKTGRQASWQDEVEEGVATLRWHVTAGGLPRQPRLEVHPIGLTLPLG